MTVFCVRNKGSDFYRYMNWFASAWEKSGGLVKEQLPIPHKLRACLGRLLGMNLGIVKGAAVICASFRIESLSWPWCHFYEIVPYLWDLWPANYMALAHFVKRNKVRHVFCTARQSANWINCNCDNVVAHWMPEAVDVSSYSQGDVLTTRPVDVLSYGRRVEELHSLLLSESGHGLVCYKAGGGAKFADLTDVLKDSRISICYPKCVTSPREAGGVETLTQRYWEAMCSRTLMVGHAPKELVDVCGYNPVIELGGNPVAQIKDILRNIEGYQEFVDRNRKCAEEKGDWISRAIEMRRILGDEK